MTTVKLSLIRFVQWAFVCGAVFVLLSPNLGWAQAVNESLDASQSLVEMPDAEIIGRTKAKAKIVMLSMDDFPDESWSEVEKRAAAELKAFGLETVSLPSKAKDMPTRLAELGAKAAAHNAVAAIRIVKKGETRRIQIWIYDAVTGKMVLRETTPAAPGADAAKFLSGQVIELLNATLIELRILKRKGIVADVPKPVEAWVERSLDPPKGPNRFSLTAGVSMLSAINGIGTTAGLSLGGGLRITDRLSAALEGFVPVFSPTVQDASSEADLMPFLFRATALYEPWTGLVVSPQFSASVGGYLVRAQGRAIAPLQGVTEWEATFHVSGGTGFVYQLTQNVKLRAHVSLGAAIKQIDIELAGTNVDKIGPLMVDGTLGIVWQWGAQSQDIN